MRILPAFFIFLVVFTGIAAGSEVHLNSSGSNSEQVQINEALRNYDRVFLEAGVYEVDGPIYIGSNRVLAGDSDAIIRVYSGSSQWFKGSIGVISCRESIKNVEIYGFQIDGNIKNLPKSYSDSRSDTDHDCEKLIILGGYSNDFAENISIHDMTFFNSFSDAVYIKYSELVDCSNNFISNCQHEGIFFSVVKRGYIYKNKIAGITSGCARLDNCMICLIEYNTFFSYNGNSFGAYKHGESGLQIGNAGVSHGYDARKDEWETSDIEVRYNTFSDPGLKAIWYHSGENVYIHDNEFVDASELETMGIPIGDISEDNQPTKEQSQSIFDILDTELTESGYVDQEELKIVNGKWEKKGKAEACIYLAGFDGEITLGKEKYLPKAPSECARVLTKTHNLADRPVNQKSSLKLKDGANNTLIVEFKVKTRFEVKRYKEIIGIKIPYYKVRSETSTFTRTFPGYPIFPTVKAPKCKVLHYNGSHAIVIIPDTPGVIKTEIKLNNSTAKEFKFIGEIGTLENGFRSTNFTKVSAWRFTGLQMSKGSDGVYVKEPFNVSNLKITVFTPFDRLEVTDIEYVRIEDTSTKIFNLGNLTLLVLIMTYGRAIYKIFNREFKRWFKNL